MIAYQKAYEYHPSELQPNFVQALLGRAKEEDQEDEQLAFYDKVLELEPEQSDAVVGCQKLYEKQGDIAYKNNELDKALEAYVKADAKEKVEKVNKKFQLENLYQQALDALGKGEKEKAQELLVEVLSTEPSFKEAAYHLHLAVKGEKLGPESKLKKGLKFLFIFIISICAIITAATAILKFLGYKPLIISPEGPVKILRLDKNQRPLEYVKNDFKGYGDTVVTDHTTGLMWQKSGSDRELTYEEAQVYVKERNRAQFGGYDKWRLPSVGELMTLIEPEKQSNNLYINPIFDEKQKWCWSSDKHSSGGAWYVVFSSGRVYRDDTNTTRYVRAVRFKK